MKKFDYDFNRLQNEFFFFFFTQPRRGSRRDIITVSVREQGVGGRHLKRLPVSFTALISLRTEPDAEEGTEGVTGSTSRPPSGEEGQY